MEDAIHLDGVGKRYWKVHEPATLLRSVLPGRRPAREELWSLRGVDLRVGRGETVGVLGRNGAGKTTLLRLLAGVSRPTEGRVRVAGRISPLISVGVGFHQEMSGRENILVNGMLLGLTREEVRERFDAIVDFAEMHDFIDTPVKFYSSGMFMRLGFSVAIHAEPDVFLLDEVLAVGDLAFQLKCFDRMREVQLSGTTILLVSHSMHAIRLLCPRAVVLRGGVVDFDGDVEDAVARHHELLSLEDGTDVPGEAGESDAGPVTFASRTVTSDDRGTTHHPRQDEPMRLGVVLRFNRDVESPLIVFAVVTEDGSVAYQLTSAIGKHFRTFRSGEVAEVAIRFMPRLAAGSFRLVTTVLSNDHRHVLARDEAPPLIYLAPRPGALGMADLEGRIEIDGAPVNPVDELALGRTADGPAPPRSTDERGSDD